MTVRCTKCSEFIFFDERRDKLHLYMNCNCGGKVEVMTNKRLSGTHPIHSGKTFYGESGAYFYAYRNDKGEYFVYNDNKLVKVENPVGVFGS